MPRTLTRTLSDTISYKTRTGYGAGGVPTWGSLLTASCKVWDIEQINRKGDGSEVTTKHVIHTYTAVPRGALLWMPDEDTDDDEAGEIVDFVHKYASLAVRGTQWTLYEIRIGKM